MLAVRPERLSGGGPERKRALVLERALFDRLHARLRKAVQREEPARSAGVSTVALDADVVDVMVPDRMAAPFAGDALDPAAGG
jgi:hypothetical protein